MERFKVRPPAHFGLFCAAAVKIPAHQAGGCRALVPRGWVVPLCVVRVRRWGRQVCEKETKTKAFSKEGLSQQPKEDPSQAPAAALPSSPARTHASHSRPSIRWCALPMGHNALAMLLAWRCCRTTSNRRHWGRSPSARRESGSRRRSHK